MKIKLLLLTTCICLFSYVNGQVTEHVHNGSFENWENEFHYEIPELSFGFEHSAFGSYYTFGESNLTRVDGVSGDAMRLETMSNDEDTIFGFIVYGSVDGGDNDTEFMDGFPLPEDDYLGFGGSFRYDLQDGDSAWVLCILKSEGEIINMNLWKLVGTEENFTEMTWEFDSLVESPDSAIIAFTSSDPDLEGIAQLDGNWIEIDDLFFVNGAEDPVDFENNDFEDWETFMTFEPEGWVTSNIFTEGGSSVRQAQNGTDGDYSVRVVSEPRIFEDEEPFGWLQRGQIYEVENGDVGIIPGDALMGEVVSVQLDYHYQSGGNGLDTAEVLVAFTKYNTVSDTTVFGGAAHAKLIPNDEMESITLALNIFDAVDSMAILISSGLIDDEDSPAYEPQQGSTLTIDNFTITTDVLGTEVTTDILASKGAYPNPCEGVLNLPAHDARVTIMNMSGKTVAEYGATEEGQPVELDKGIYIVEFTNLNNKINIVQRVVVQ